MLAFKLVLGLTSSLAWCFDASNALVPQIQRKYQSINQHHDALQSRRDALRNAFLLSSPLVATALVLLPSDPANALEQCKPKSHNCIRTAWTAPSNLSAAEVVNTIREVLNSYPQEGQAGVDCSGWRIVKDALDAEAGIITLEYKSCIGPAAVAINLAQPFIDDLKLELSKDVNTISGFIVEVRSSSRMGSGDLFVNRKRLEYLGKKLKEKGWDVPKPLYVYEMKK